MSVDPRAVKAESEKSILETGGQICDWLPHLDRSKRVRSRDAVVGRALVLNALVNIYFQAPISVIADWIEQNGASSHLSAHERAILAKTNDQLSEQEKLNLYWLIEALWALMWVGGLIDRLPVTTGVEDYMASLLPDLQQGDDGEKLTTTMQLRPVDDIFKMLDLYYRAHWYARDCQLNGRDAGSFNGSIILERRRALEWVLDDSLDWDHVDLST